MFEINDKDVGKVKIFNVTSARTSFAKILKDKGRAVIITRGKPTKIIIDYNEFKQILKKING